jgi:cysteinyl-tRNA synthetase
LEELGKLSVEFEAAMDDDLDSHTALDILHAISGSINEYLTGPPNKGVILRAYLIYKRFLNTLGLFERRGGGTNELTSELVKTMIEMRNQFRKEKNYSKSDEIRAKLAAIGVILSDTGGETHWKIEKK